MRDHRTDQLMPSEFVNDPRQKQVLGLQACGKCALQLSVPLDNDPYLCAFVMHVDGGFTTRQGSQVRTGLPAVAQADFYTSNKVFRGRVHVFGPQLDTNDLLTASRGVNLDSSRRVESDFTTTLPADHGPEWVIQRTDPSFLSRNRDLLSGVLVGIGGSLFASAIVGLTSRSTSRRRRRSLVPNLPPASNAGETTH